MKTASKVLCELTLADALSFLGDTGTKQKVMDACMDLITHAERSDFDEFLSSHSEAFGDEYARKKVYLALAIRMHLGIDPSSSMEVILDEPADWIRRDASSFIARAPGGMSIATPQERFNLVKGIWNLIAKQSWACSEKEQVFDAARACYPASLEFVVVNFDYVPCLESEIKRELVELGKQAPFDVCQVLLKYLKHDKPQVRSLCMNTLSELGDLSVDWVIETAKNSLGYDTREHAIRTLGLYNCSQEPIIGALLGIIQAGTYKGNKPSVKKFSNQKKLGTWQKLLSYIGKSSQLAQTIMERDDYQATSLRQTAIYSLGDIGKIPSHNDGFNKRPPTFMALPVLSQEALPVLATLLVAENVEFEHTEKRHSLNIHDALEHAISEIGESDITSSTRYVLSDLLVHELPRVRASACRIICRLHYELHCRTIQYGKPRNMAESFGRMFDRTDRSDSAVRLARHCLIDFDNIFPVVSKQLLVEIDEDATVHLLRALKCSTGTVISCASRVIELAGSASSEVSAAALECLSVCPEPSELASDWKQVVLKALCSDNEDVLRHAIKVVEVWGDKISEALPLLRSLQKHENRWIQQCASGAIKRILCGNDDPTCDDDDDEDLEI